MGELDRRLHAYRDDLAAKCLEGRVAAPRYVDGAPQQAIVGLAPLKRSPADSSAQDTEVLYGESVTVYDSRSGWSWVQLAKDGYVGYLPTSALGPALASTHKVTAERTFLYPEPNIKSPVVAALSLGSELAATETANGFLKLSRGGYVVARHAAPIGWFAPDFVAVAERFVGIPYLWGGRSTKGFDCSGLLQLSMQAAGLDCPRDSDMQGTQLGVMLPKDAPLRRGDLVLWPGHVGIMTDATNLLHANAHHMQTVIEPLAEAVARIASTGPLVRGVRRLPALGKGQ
jgi:cell wall-associated NlpC family hydrolase